jgi:hypothetical protein
MQLALPPISALSVKRGLALAAALVLVAALIAAARNSIFSLVLPLFLWEISWLGTDFTILGIGTHPRAADSYIVIEAVLARPIVGAGRILYPDAQLLLVAEVLSGYVPQTIIMFAGVLIAWPLRGWRSGIARLVLAPPALLATLMIDVPLVLLSLIWKIVNRTLGDTGFQPLLAWEHFLTYGGRLGLAVIAGIATVLIADRLARVALRDKPNSEFGVEPK